MCLGTCNVDTKINTKGRRGQLSFSPSSSHRSSCLSSSSSPASSSSRLACSCPSPLLVFVSPRRPVFAPPRRHISPRCRLVCLPYRAAFFPLVPSFPPRPPRPTSPRPPLFPCRPASPPLRLVSPSPTLSSRLSSPSSPFPSLVSLRLRVVALLVIDILEQRPTSLRKWEGRVWLEFAALHLLERL